ncbi:MAG: C10 family peptidase [Alistipes sp.]|nr:C10 family peptidase [Alistipes sp.]
MTLNSNTYPYVKTSAPTLKRHLFVARRLQYHITLRPHCNWGWDGLYDGYFLPSFLHPRQGNIQPDPDSDTSIRIDHEYSWNFKLFVNIKPA